jgi:hypothetical protein
MPILLKAIYGFNAMSIKNPMSLFANIKKSILKFIWKHKRPQIAKVILRKMSNTVCITMPASNYTAEP